MMSFRLGQELQGSFTSRVRQGVVLLFCVALAGCSEPKKIEPEQPRPVKTVLLSSDSSADQVSLIGDVEPEQETILGFRIGGRIIERKVDVGDKVSKGELLAALDTSDAKNQLANAQAKLVSAQSSLNLAKITYERYKKLLSTHVISQSQFDMKKSDYDTALSQYESAKSAVKEASDNVSYTKLLAPESGVVTLVSGNVGQVVSAGQEVVKLASLTQRNAVFDVPEEMITNTPPHSEITVSLLSDPSIKTTGTVRDVSPQANTNTRTYRVRIKLTTIPKEMVLGAIVKGSVRLRETNIIQLPALALTRQGKQPAVYVFDQSTQSVHLQPVTIARYSNDSIFVSKGLSTGMRVVVAGVSTLRPGMKVTLFKDEN
ncbi:efflux RND transporter periplasmic adaptor subunit [Marinomonas spartinae]|uniref:efflux RND transporter periplasmic adaptor subunit n=1 Tax=Marinomonas spartinae TaxID=1792290 RepID=UPI0018F268CD|nr:efflux RND transporter periplasmic adaptor subunit [Marinomonas spartinae]MBJ7555363.1 efflux RND transporter periplasmic adaptor subunit [Marinomonas spartinae]